jgi:hypothetical protein
MAALINHSNFTFTADELRSYSELIVKKLTEVPELNAFHTFETGIKNDRRIGLTDGSFGLLGKAAQTCGSRTPDSKLLGTQQKTWEPKRAEVLLRECWDDLDTTMGRLARKLGNDVYDLSGTDYMTFLLSILEPDILRMIFRMAWFNDKAAATVTDSPAGVLTTGTSTTYFTLFDGFFAQLGDIITTTPARQTDLSAYNGQASYALQDSTLTNALAYAALLKVIDDAPPALRSQADRAIICTGSVGRKAMRYLQDKGLAFTLDYALNGLTLINIDGNPIYIVEWWDEFIRTYEDNGTKYNLPHRIVYTKKANLMVGMEGTNLFESFDVWHDKTTKYTWIEATDAFDAKIIEDGMVQYGV